MTSSLPTLESLGPCRGKTVLVRVDLNVPMEGGRVADDTRIARMLPTVHYLLEHGARIVLLSHFDRPEGKYVPSMSLAPLVDPLSAALDGREIHFGVDCIGETARETVKNLRDGDIALLENLRFHPQEETGDAAFAKELASLGQMYVNDAFSCSHRAHASITGIAPHLPSAAGRLLHEEITALESLFADASGMLAAIVGGAKISSKLPLLQHLVTRVNLLIIGGAMANTFLLAQGHVVGESLVEKQMLAQASTILQTAKKHQCRVILPVDVVVANTLTRKAACEVWPITQIPPGGMIVDLGPASLAQIGLALQDATTCVWNGPMGAFEVPPFDCGTMTLARILAGYTAAGELRSIAGGGDTLSALSNSGLAHAMSYVSTAGGAFLEWLEGKDLPGIAVLRAQQNSSRSQRKGATS